MTCLASTLLFITTYPLDRIVRPAHKVDESSSPLGAKPDFLLRKMSYEGRGCNVSVCSGLSRASSHGGRMVHAAQHYKRNPETQYTQQSLCTHPSNPAQDAPRWPWRPGRWGAAAFPRRRRPPQCPGGGGRLSTETCSAGSAREDEVMVDMVVVIVFIQRAK